MMPAFNPAALVEIICAPNHSLPSADDWASAATFRRGGRIARGDVRRRAFAHLSGCNRSANRCAALKRDPRPLQFPAWGSWRRGAPAPLPAAPQSQTRTRNDYEVRVRPTPNGRHDATAAQPGEIADRHRGRQQPASAAAGEQTAFEINQRPPRPNGLLMRAGKRRGRTVSPDAAIVLGVAVVALGLALWGWWRL